MRNIRVQTESIQLSIYCNIICQTLQRHEKLSICKTVTFSYLIKQNRFLGGTIYTARNTQDIIYKGISLLAGDFDGFCKSVPYILKALHLLMSRGIVDSKNDILYLTTKQLKLDSTNNV
ncbi:hypothetical protein [Oceanobacillus sp. CFH 90083]|uniref:hypothetical protein n=1 Tax=Oceanobacillus sp. CFH 90083 TaxID=2592336 RepID=UPI00128C756D|nr:hypothetical protein [Oceanobacillus sp. CFH 90083]